MASVEQTMMKVQRILTGPMQLRVQLDGDGFMVRFDDASTALRINVHEFGKDREGEPRSLVRLSSLILRNVRATPALYEWLAREDGYLFGHIELVDEEKPGHVALLMAHTLLGDFLDAPELEAAMWAVLGTADTLDDELKAKFGGERWVD